MSNDFQPVACGVIGAGAVSDAYLTNLCGQFSDVISVKAVAAGHLESARRKAAQWGLRPLRWTSCWQTKTSRWSSC